MSAHPLSILRTLSPAPCTPQAPRSYRPAGRWALLVRVQGVGVAQSGRALGGSSGPRAGSAAARSLLAGWVGRPGRGRAIRGAAFGLRSFGASGAGREQQDGGGSGRGAPGAGVRRQGRAGLPMRAGVPGPQLGNWPGSRRLGRAGTLVIGEQRGPTGAAQEGRRDKAGPPVHPQT